MNRQTPSANRLQLEDLLYQALETELGGIEVYRMALLCAKNPDLKEEWKKYWVQTKRHAEKAAYHRKPKYREDPLESIESEDLEDDVAPPGQDGPVEDLDDDEEVEHQS